MSVHQLIYTATTTAAAAAAVDTQATVDTPMNKARFPLAQLTGRQLG